MCEHSIADEMAVLLNIPGPSGPSGPSGKRHAILALSRRPNMAELAGDRIKPSLRHPPDLLLVILSVPFSLLSGPYLVSPVLPPQARPGQRSVAPSIPLCLCLCSVFCEEVVLFPSKKLGKAPSPRLLVSLAFINHIILKAKKARLFLPCQPFSRLVSPSTSRSASTHRVC